MILTLTKHEFITFSGNMSNYAKRMTRLSARIFGEVIRPTDKE